MTIKRPWMISLLAISGLSSAACTRSATVPPQASRTLPPATAPEVARIAPHEAEPPFFQLPTLSIDPWKPAAPPREWNAIVIHHTATTRGSVESIHEAHLSRKDKKGNPWLGIGYHFVIGNGNGMTDGAIEPTFRWREQMHGAHAGNREYNQHGIGIVLVGNFENEPPTAAQMSAVKRLVGTLKSRYAIASDKVIGHGDIKATECPGKYFPMTEISRSHSRIYLGQHRTEESPGVELVGWKRNWMP